MKKLLLLFLGGFLLNIHSFAANRIEFVTSIIDSSPIGNSAPKSPIQPPVVYIDDYTLTFSADHPEYVLTIKNEESEVVYTTVVSSAETQVLLPTTLSGEYQIELAMGNWLFTGWIELYY